MKDEFKQIQLEIPVPTEDDWRHYEEYLEKTKEQNQESTEGYFIEIQM